MGRGLATAASQQQLLLLNQSISTELVSLHDTHTHKHTATKTIVCAYQRVRELARACRTVIAHPHRHWTAAGFVIRFAEVLVGHLVSQREPCAKHPDTNNSAQFDGKWSPSNISIVAPG